MAFTVTVFTLPGPGYDAKALARLTRFRQKLRKLKDPRRSELQEKIRNPGKKFVSSKQHKTRRKIRLDQFLKEAGLASDLEKSRALIMSGQVVVNEQRVDKAGVLIHPGDRVRLKSRGPFVSRGGEKLRGVIDILGITDNFHDTVVLDAGASTGGFTDCVLSLGARSVIALDVGSNQLAWSLRQDIRVISLEKTDIRDFKPEDWPPINWVVADLSFISLRTVAASLAGAGARDCRYLILVKPQFELPQDLVPEGGVIEDPAHRDMAVRNCIDLFRDAGLRHLASVEAPVRGKTGNQEVFLYLSGS